MSNVVIFYFPGGDAGTRTELSGKKAILDWRDNIKQSSYITKMTYLNYVDLPVIAKHNLPYADTVGSVCYFLFL